MAEDRFDSTDEARSDNNSMRHTYRHLSEIEKQQVAAIKDMGRGLADYCADIGSSRELSLARTKIEEAVMWAVKHITR